MKNINDLMDEFERGKVEIKITREADEKRFKIEAQATAGDMLDAYGHFTVAMLDTLIKSGMSKSQTLAAMSKLFLIATDDYLEGNYEEEVKNFEMAKPNKAGGTKKC